MPDVRLIERWLPIAALGVESVRERTPMTPFPAPNRLHVWWARRPLVASRAAVLASLLPADADQDKFLHALGIHGDPVAARDAIDRARRTGVRVKDPYGYGRAYGYVFDQDDRAWVTSMLDDSTTGLTVLDPTAGGGSIPFETMRMGLAPLANDLNPVAALIMKATVEWPSSCCHDVRKQFDSLATEWRRRIEDRLSAYFPQWDLPDRVDLTYLWARTITCPYCDGLVPLSPNWRLAPNGTGVRLKPRLGGGPRGHGRVCSFEIVRSAKEQSAGTVARGTGTCPYPDCGRVIDGDEIKRQAQAGQMGEQLFAVAYKKRVPKILKSGRPGKDKWVRGYRAPRPEDDNVAEIQEKLAEKLPEWDAFDFVPSERFPDVCNDDRPIQYGMPMWRDLFSPRQLLCHGTSVEVFREMLDADRSAGVLNEVRRAAYGYLALSLDKLRDYNSRMTRWHVGRQVMVNTFDRHDFSFKWSYAEMAPLIVGLGYDWAIRQTAKCIDELVALIRPESNGRAGGLFDDAETAAYAPPPVTITCKPGDSLDHIAEGSIDAVVMDPPYYDNVMYAELSDFFYVWLKRTAGHVFPDLFRRHLTDKDNEAVANPARFQGQKGARALAGRDYQERMASIFAECHRVLKPDGVMTLMFTHKATGAWDALTKGLMEGGFIITASWPVKTESEGGLHIRNKAAAKSTIFLVCRPRNYGTASGAPAVYEAVAAYGEDTPAVYWEDVEPRVAEAVRKRVKDFQKAGISGVDLYLACFGPALKEFSRNWPLRRGTPREIPKERRRRRQLILFEDEWDPYEATPEDALNVARREVKRWRLEQLTHLRADADLDTTTAFFVLAWDTFEAPVFSYDEALTLARAVGVDLDSDIVGRLAEKKGGNIRLWDSTQRAAKGTFGPVDGSRGMIDAIHRVAHMARVRTLAAGREMIEAARLKDDPRFFAAFEAVLEVLPVSRAWTDIPLEGDVKAAGEDFEVLENLRRLAYTDKVDRPKQLGFWTKDGA